MNHRPDEYAELKAKDAVGVSKVLGNGIPGGAGDDEVYVRVTVPMHDVHTGEKIGNQHTDHTVEELEQKRDAFQACADSVQALLDDAAQVPDPEVGKK